MRKYSAVSGPLSEMITKATLGPVPGIVISRSGWRPKSGALERSPACCHAILAWEHAGIIPGPLAGKVRKAADTDTGSAGNLPWPVSSRPVLNNHGQVRGHRTLDVPAVSGTRAIWPSPDSRSCGRVTFWRAHDQALLA